MSRILILGAGRIGYAMAEDLALDDALSVTITDTSEQALTRFAHSPIQVLRLDATDEKALASATQAVDVVINALPSAIGYSVLQSLLKLGCTVVDITFGGGNPLELDAIACKHNALAVVDCGVAPGLSNLLLGAAMAERTVLRYECLVGGLPMVRRQPFAYSAPFAPGDVIEEYTRPARFRMHGKPVVRAALSDVEQVTFRELGTLEAFNTDGLRTLLDTTEVPTMIEKTLRWPGHAAAMVMLRDGGFFDTEKLPGFAHSPLQHTSAVLGRQWKPDPSQPEFTVLRVDIDSGNETADKRQRYELIDYGDDSTGHTSMARCTGYFATSMVRALLHHRPQRCGVLAPEQLGTNTAAVTQILGDLNARGLQLRQSQFKI